ncbi:hypothetical protein [Phenylobacterium sp.]|jgi:hypothetical protein|uniref:hypothetical protein n=1 Tax=Phenylobacterium sp. TaxID=1871053 RepID=UPI002E31B279|nr:hypothetical protein [Phenylobacterium sp.]HEX2561382.1 hypothetical protein [Phenylobacterium sp.]
MRIVLLVVAALTASGCAPLSLEQGKRLAARYAGDPAGVEFRDLVVHERHVCGQMSIVGAKGGFRGFIAELDTGQVIREPELESPAGLTPYERAVDQLDRGSSLLDFSATSLQLCGRSVASPAFETARQALSRHVGLPAIPRLDESPQVRAEH